MPVTGLQGEVRSSHPDPAARAGWAEVGDPPVPDHPGEMRLGVARSGGCFCDREDLRGAVLEGGFHVFRGPLESARGGLVPERLALPPGLGPDFGQGALQWPSRDGRKGRSRAGRRGWSA